jgi:hypothetical protein
MNNPNSRLNTIGAAVKVLQSNHKIEHTVQQLILQHPLTSSAKHIQLPRNILQLSPKILKIK